MWPINREKLILLLCGMNLMLLQFVMLQEFSVILTGIEFVVLLLSASFFLGFSVGYAVSDRLSQRAVEMAVIVLFLLHLTLPFSPRWMAGWLALHGAEQYTLMGMLFIAAFLMSTVYSVFLPRMIDKKSSSESVGACYSMELLGSLLGLGVLGVALLSGQLLWVMLFYFAVMIFIAGLLRPRWVTIGALSALTILYGFSFARLDRSSVEYFFRNARHFSKAHSLYRVNSPYQKVDVVENERGDRFLYLNGLLDFNTRQLEAFNFFLSEVPARLQKESRVLIVGSGSMSSVSHVAPYASSIQTVELDSAVATAGRKYFANFNHLATVKNWSLSIDDAKHYLGSHPGEKYDLVVMDVPSPKTIQEAMLHSTEFYSLVGEHLTERGVLSVSLCGRLEPGNSTPTSIAAALMQALPRSYAVTSSSARRSFAVAGRDLKFSQNDIEAILLQRPNERFAVFDRLQMEEIVGGSVPISQNRMDVVLTNNLRRLGWMYFPSLLKGL